MRRSSGTGRERSAQDEESLARGDLTPEQADLVEREISFMRSTDMAVVISQSQNEIAEMAARGLDIRPHRKRMVEEKLEDKFKDAQDPFRHRVRLLDVDDRVRRPVAVDRLPR